MSDKTIEQRLQELESKDKEVLLKSNIELPVNSVNIHNLDFIKYRKLRFVFFRKDESSNRNAEKIFEIPLINDNIVVSFTLDAFWIWLSANKQSLDVRRQTAENQYKFCDIYRYYINKRGGRKWKK